MNPLVKSTPNSPLPLPLFLQEIATKKYHFLSNKGKIYIYLCALLFEFIVSWYLRMPFGVMYLKIWSSIQPHISVWTLELCSVSLFLVEHAQHTILSASEVSVCFVLCQISRLVGVWSLPFLHCGLSLRHPSHFLY